MIDLYDSTNALAIPASAPAVAGYVDGKWPSFGGAKARFPNVPAVSITVTAQIPAEVVDCEPGNLRPAGAVETVHRGLVKVVYCPADGHGDPAYTQSAVQAAAQAAGIACPPLWLAWPDWDGTELPEGVVAIQHTYTGAWDLSSADESWLGINPSPTTPLPLPPPQVYPDGVTKLTGSVEIASGGGNITPEQLQGLELGSVISVVPFADGGAAPITFAGVDAANNCLRFVGLNGGPYGFEVWQAS